MNTLKARQLPRNGRMPRTLVVCAYNGLPVKRIPIAEVQEAFIANQRLDSRDPSWLSFRNLMVQFEGDADDARGSYASYRQRWLADEGVWIITEIYNSHGAYPYADLRN